jgi:hypothetical protein
MASGSRLQAVAVGVAPPADPPRQIPRQLDAVMLQRKVDELRPVVDVRVEADHPSHLRTPPKLRRAQQTPRKTLRRRTVCPQAFPRL